MLSRKQGRSFPTPDFPARLAVSRQAPPRAEKWEKWRKWCVSGFAAHATAVVDYRGSTTAFKVYVNGKLWHTDTSSFGPAPAS